MSGRDAGDFFGDGHSYKLPSDATGSKGETVKINGSGQVTPTTATGDAVVGVLAEDSPASAGDEVGVLFTGRMGVTADGSVTTGDTLGPSGTTDGHVVSVAANEGLVTAVDEGGTDTYDIWSRAFVALEDATDGDVFEALLV